MKREVFIVQLGLGGVGRELIRQLLDQQEALAERYGIELIYLALVDRGGALFTGRPIDPGAVAVALGAKQVGRSVADLDGGQHISIAELATILPAQPCIIVDTTAADGNEAALIDAVAAGHRVVLANKRPLTGACADFERLTAGGATRYEVTVGAALPVISLLQSLIDSGDRVIRIDASLSGTLGFLCNSLEQGQKLSTAVRYARAQGWSEPDPRDDLSGADVARKTLILARMCGLRWEMDAIRAEAWFPPDMATMGVDEFLEQLDRLDAPFAERVAQAQARQQVLRYGAVIEPGDTSVGTRFAGQGTGSASVGLRELPLDHPLASLRGPDNLFVITTSRYTERPLVVRGPGAGIAVTAAGVLGDIIATARELS